MLLLFGPLTCRADDIRLTVDVSSQDNLVRVLVHNTGRDQVSGIHLGLELDGKSSAADFPQQLAAGASAESTTRVRMPAARGSFPLVIMLTYRNEGGVLGLVNVGYFHNGEPAILPGDCPLFPLRVRHTAVLQSPLAEPSRLILPAQFRIRDLDAGRRWSIENEQPRFSTASDAFLVAEKINPDGRHSTLICSSPVHSTRTPAAFSLLSTRVLCVLSIAALLFSFLIFRKLPPQPSWGVEPALCRAGFSLFLVGLLLLFSRVAGEIPDLLLDRLHPAQSGLGPFLGGALDAQLRWLYFQGGDYDYFFQYVADPLYFYFLFGNFWVLLLLIRPDPATDKNWQLLRSVFSVLKPENTGGHGLFWSAGSKNGLLALLVKAFYVPLVCSWTVNNIFHQWNLWRGLTPTFLSLNECIVALLIFIDVFVFTVGYLVELPQLKNTIRSVEPTMFGWLVCLICYPPFNQLIFFCIDRPFARFQLRLVNGWVLPAEIAVTILWAIYVWATLALAFKSSNLTNRGCVRHGPYHYCRHPAYTAKVTLWIISAVFLGTLNLLLIPVYILIYGLRAWTEERHLALDPEYREYQAEVPWKLIPKIW
jgi:protein-S-isoprenylcysteine O-methyltransferase Ste14